MFIRWCVQKFQMGFILLTLVSHQSYLATAILVHLRQWCSQHTTHQGHPDTNKTTAKKRIVPVHELRVWERVFRKCYLRSPVLAVFACVSVAAETVSYMGLATKNYIWECLNRFLFNLVLVKIVLISGVCVCATRFLYGFGDKKLVWRLSGINF